MTLTTRAGKGTPLTAIEHDSNLTHLDMPTVNVETFGAVGDGSTDNATALIAMRDWCEANLESATILFPRGHYRYTNNKWVPRLKTLEISGYGAKLQCAVNTGQSGNRGHLWQGNPFQGRGVGNPGSYPATSGYKFDTASATSVTLTMTTSGQEANFTAGDMVLTAGCDQQGNGFPPNFRYFEWNTVASVGSGTVTLTEPLRYDYDDAWPENGDGWGKPIIVNLNRTAVDDFVMSERLAIRGIEWLPNSVAPYPSVSNSFQPMARHVLVEDCTIYGNFWPSMVETFEARNCWIEHAGDIDKLVDRVIIDNCDVMDSIRAATGINALIVKNSRITNEVMVSPKKFVFHDNDAFNMGADGTDYGALRHYNIGNSELWSVKGNSFYGKQATRPMVQNGTATPPGWGSMTALAGADGAFTIASLTDVRNLGIGAVIHNTTMTKIAKVTRIGHDGTNWVVEHTKGVTFSAAEAVKFSYIQKIEWEGNSVWEGGKRTYRDFAIASVQGAHLMDRAVFRGQPFIASANPHILYFNWSGYAKKITFRLIKAQSVANRIQMSVKDGADATIQLFAGSSGASGDYVTVDLEAGSVAWTGSWTSTSGLSSPLVQPIVQVTDCRISNSAGTAPAYVDERDLPTFEITIEGAGAIA